MMLPDIKHILIDRAHQTVSNEICCISEICCETTCKMPHITVGYIKGSREAFTSNIRCIVMRHISFDRALQTESDEIDSIDGTGCRANCYMKNRMYVHFCGFS